MIFRVGAGEERNRDTAAKRVDPGKGEHRKGVGILGRDTDLTVSAWLVAVDVVLRQAFEFGGIGLDHVLAVGNIAIKHGLLFGGLVVQFFEAGGGGVGFFFATAAGNKEVGVGGRYFGWGRVL